jgi:hypothetical protein
MVFEKEELLATAMLDSEFIGDNLARQIPASAVSCRRR